MIKIMFVCHGNICRSPMAEFIMKDLVKQEGLEDKIYIESSATSREEIGNPVHPGTRKILSDLSISCKDKRARQFTQDDYNKYDYIIIMDQLNSRNISRIIGRDRDNKISKLLDYSNDYSGDIADPWYTGEFDTTYEHVLSGCQGLLKAIKKNHNI